MALPPSGGVVRDLAAVVEIPALPMVNARQDLAFGGTIGSEFIGHDHSGHVAQALPQLAEKAVGRPRVAAALDQHIKHIPMLIDRSPEIHAAALDGDHHLASRAGESHPRALPEPDVTWSRASASYLPVL